MWLCVNPMSEDEEKRLAQSLKAVNSRYSQKIMTLDPSENTLDPNGNSCSFCGKAPEEYEDVVVGPGVRICNGCVASCVEILQERKEEGAT